MDLLRVQNIEVMCRIGCSDEEKCAPRLLLIDLEIPINSARAAAQDELSDAVDYAPMAETVRAVVTERSYHLIETVAERVAARLLSDYHLPSILVRVTKPHPTTDPPIGAAVVEVRRGAVSKEQLAMSN